MTGTETTKAFADRLQGLIAEKNKQGVKLEAISNASGVPVGSLSKYQNDNGEAGINSIVKLAQYFGVTTDYLLGLNPCRTTETENISPKDLHLSEGAVNMLLKPEIGFLQAIGIYDADWNQDLCMSFAEDYPFLSFKRYIHFRNLIIEHILPWMTCETAKLENYKKNVVAQSKAVNSESVKANLDNFSQFCKAMDEAGKPLGISRENFMWANEILQFEAIRFAEKAKEGILKLVDPPQSTNPSHQKEE